jgi:hypothetical protein
MINLLFLLTLFVQMDKNISAPNVIQQIEAEQAIEVAQDTYKYISENIHGYTGLFVKRELVNGKDTGYQYIEFKYRENPKGIYLKFLKPASLQNREVLYNGGNDLVVRRGGRSNSNLTLVVGIDSPLVTEGNRHTIHYMGIKELGRTLIEKLKEEAFLPETVIKIYDTAKFDDRPVVHYRMSHVPSPDYKASSLMSEVAIDKELNIPIYYRALDKDKEGNWIILEEYAFRNIKINPVFEDTEFTEQHPGYGFSQGKQ